MYALIYVLYIYIFYYYLWCLFCAIDDDIGVISGVGNFSAVYYLRRKSQMESYLFSVPNSLMIQIQGHTQLFKIDFPSEQLNSPISRNKQK